MDVAKAIKKRRSIRHFQSKSIPRDFEEKLIEALIWAPSAGNLQSRKFYLVKDKTVKEKLVNLALYQSFVLEAPLVIVACADSRVKQRYSQRGRNLYSICDTAVSIENLMLQTTELGLGSCWVGSFDEDKIKEILTIPDYLKPIAVIPIGFPAEKPEAPPRAKKEEVIEYK